MTIAIHVDFMKVELLIRGMEKCESIFNTFENLKRGTVQESGERIPGHHNFIAV